MIPGMIQVIHPHMAADLSFVIDCVASVSMGVGMVERWRWPFGAEGYGEGEDLIRLALGEEFLGKKELSLVHQTREHMGSWKPTKWAKSSLEYESLEGQVEEVDYFDKQPISS